MAIQRSQLWIIFLLILFALAAGCSAPASPAGMATSVATANTATSIPVSPAATSTVFLYFTPIPTPTVTPTATPPSRTLAAAPSGIWISPEELAALPMEGAAWERLKETADGELEVPNMAGFGARHDVQTLAVALVYARTGNEGYREKASQAIRAVMGTEYTGLRTGPDSEQGALALSVGRNLVSYVIAADLVDLARYDAQLDAEFRDWLAGLLHAEWPDGSIVMANERRANNQGRMAGASRAAVAAYLGDEEELTRTASVFKGFLGDRQAYAGFSFTRDLSWQADLSQPVGINPRGAVTAGFAIDGALPEEMRRGCSFQIPPCHTGYPWEGLQGIVVEANILHRQGFDVWNWEDQAILRAVQFLHTLKLTYEHDPSWGYGDDTWWATGDDTWIPWLINHAYGTDFPTEKANIGKNMGWTDWTHAPVER